MDFLNDDNICGQNILRITSRGSAIIAELFRLAGVIPEEFFQIPPNLISSTTSHNNNNNLCTPSEYLFDFQYLRDPDDFEKKISSNPSLLDIDHDFQENHQEVLERFYNLFESIWKYQVIVIVVIVVVIIFFVITMDDIINVIIFVVIIIVDFVSIIFLLLLLLLLLLFLL